MSTNYYKLQVNNIDSLTMSGILSPNALRVFCWIGNQVVEGNKANIDTKGIASHFDMDKSVISKVLKELVDGLLIKVEESKGSMRVIAVSPTFFYRGEYTAQPGVTKRWYADIRKTKWGSVIQDTDEFLTKTKEEEK